MDNKELYICSSCGNPKVYLTFYGKETTDIKQAAKCTSKSCAKILIEDYKRDHKKVIDLFFVVEEYIED